jgi:hypothetical protein
LLWPPQIPPNPPAAAKIRKARTPPGPRLFLTRSPKQFPAQAFSHACLARIVRRAASKRGARGISSSNEPNKTEGIFEMTKFFSIAAAFALFAPIAAAVLMQASQIVA